MKFIRIDDYNKENHRLVYSLIEESIKVFSDIKIIIGVIVSETDIFLLRQILDNFGENVIVAFHGFSHKRDEFLGNLESQNRSFRKAESFFGELGYGGRYFFPPYNNLNDVTVKLLIDNRYDFFSINYKDFRENRGLLEGKFSLYETNIFFNKRGIDGNWYIDDLSKIKRDLDNLLEQNIDIGVEVHPQYVRSEEDMEKYVFLLNLLEKKCRERL